MAFPEAASQGNERIEFSNFKETKNNLNKLKKRVEAKTDAGDIMANLVNKALEELNKELEEANIPENERESYLAEYRARVGQETTKMMADKMIDSAEATALEGFMSDINNFPKLKAINDALGKSDLEKKHGKTIAKIDDILSTFAGFLGWNIGEPHLRAKIYEGVEWLAKKVGINLGGELNEVQPNRSENFDNKDVSDLLRLASKTGSEGGSVRNFLSRKFPKEQFGELKRTSETTLTFNINNKEIVYELKRNAMGTPTVALDGKEQVYDGKLESLMVAMSKLNPLDNRNS